MLEEGKVYLVKTTRGSIWLFKKYLGIHFRNKITGCHGALCLDDMYKTNEEGYVCRDDEIMWIKPANENYLAIWNRVFNDNIDIK
jgi:hypothetical protein